MWKIIISAFYWSKDGDEWKKGSWKSGKFDYLIVDEAQDFLKEDILLFKSKATKALLLVWRLRPTNYTSSSLIKPLSLWTKWHILLNFR